MKVAILTHFPRNPLRPHGGVEAVSVNLVTALSRMGDLDIHVITLDDSIMTVDLASFRGATIHRLPRARVPAIVNAAGQGRRQIARYLDYLQPDVIHAHDTYGIMVRGLARPRVFTIHGFIHADTLLSNANCAWLRSIAWKQIETRSWAEQPHIISISPYVRERLSGIASGIIHDIDNPIAESFFQIDRREGRNIVFSAAVISRRKNTIALVRAFASLLKQGFKGELRIAGKIVEPDYGASLLKLISELGLDNSITLLGEIDSPQVQAELAVASVFALVSFEEGSPMGIEEAMAAGVPIVTSNRCGMPYMVRHGESGFLVNPFDTLDISRRLEQMLLNDDLRTSMGNLARSVALDRFHPDSVARRTREVYLEAAR